MAASTPVQAFLVALLLSLGGSLPGVAQDGVHLGDHVVGGAFRGGDDLALGLERAEFREVGG